MRVFIAKEDDFLKFKLALEVHGQLDELVDSDLRFDVNLGFEHWNVVGVVLQELGEVDFNVGQLQILNQMFCFLLEVSFSVSGNETAWLWGVDVNEFVVHVLEVEAPEPVQDPVLARQSLLDVFVVLIKCLLLRNRNYFSVLGVLPGKLSLDI